MIQLSPGKSARISYTVNSRTERGKFAVSNSGNSRAAGKTGLDQTCYLQVIYQGRSAPENSQECTELDTLMHRYVCPVPAGLCKGVCPSISSHVPERRLLLCVHSPMWHACLPDPRPSLAPSPCGCQPVAGEWPEGRLPWVLLLSQLSLMEVAEAQTAAKSRSSCPLKQMVLPTGCSPYCSLHGSPSSLPCPFCFSSCTSSVPGTCPPVSLATFGADLTALYGHLGSSV